MPSDRWLARYFYQNRKKVGSRDRKFLSETIYAIFRHKSFLEAWVEKAKPRPIMTDIERGSNVFVFMRLPRKGLSAKRISAILSNRAKKSTPRLREHLLARRRGPKSKEEMMALLYSFPLCGLFSAGWRRSACRKRNVCSGFSAKTASRASR